MSKQEFLWTLDGDKKIRTSRIREFVIIHSTTRSPNKFLVMAWLNETDGYAVAECDSREDAKIWVDQNT